MQTPNRSSQPSEDRRGAVYLRVSTSRQETLTQDEQCLRYCDFQADTKPEFRDPETFKDTDVSGSKPFALRPGGGRLIQAIQRDEIAFIVVSKLDRLGRNTEDLLRVCRICEQHKTPIHFLDLGSSTDGPVGKLIITIFAAVAEMELQRIQERIRDRLASKRRQRTVEGSFGEVCGTIPYGFQAVSTTRLNAKEQPIQELVIEPDEHRVLQQLISMRYGTAPWIEEDKIQSSRPDRPPSYRKLATWLNHQGIPNKSGTEWSQGSVAHVLDNTYTRLLIESAHEDELAA